MLLLFLSDRTLEEVDSQEATPAKDSMAATGNSKGLLHIQEISDMPKERDAVTLN